MANDDPVPPYTCAVVDPDNREFWVYSYKELTTLEAGRVAEQFRTQRARKMPKNFNNLPMRVVLTLHEDGKVTARGLPTQRQLDEKQRIQNRRAKAIEKHKKSLRKKPK